MAYITKDQWAQFKNYATWVAYIADNKFPGTTQMDLYISIITANIDSKAGSSGISGHDSLLLGISFNSLENIIMAQSEVAAGRPRPQNIPANYIWSRDEAALDGLDGKIDKRGVLAC